MDDLAAHKFEIDGPESSRTIVSENPSDDANSMEEVRSAMDILTRVDLDLAYSSDKLMNLDNLLMHVLALGNAFEVVFEYDNISLNSMEKAIEFDLLHAILISGVKELDNFIRTLQAQVIYASDKISAYGVQGEVLSVMQSKLYDTEELLKKSQDHILEMKMQLAKLQMTSSAFNRNEWRSSLGVDVSEKFQVSGIYLRPELQSVGKQHILRMLEKSLGRELDLEKKLTDMKQNEEDLKLKIRLTEQVALCMEEAAEVIWGRFLEAENAAEVLMGISKDMIGRLQVVQFTLDSSTNREQQLNIKLQEYIAEINAKEKCMEKLNSQWLAEKAQAAFLSEKVEYLAKQLRESTCQLKEANESIENSQEQLTELESIVQTMKETIDVAESRAENAEAKFSQLTETNLELTEELGFLKESNDNNTKKVSFLEKQLRDLELQLQHAKASSEVSQEQQNMLYSAIWDMETLIDEMKQKVSKAETKTDNAEEQCLILSEANLDLNKEVEFLRNRVEFLETSLDQATVEKMASAKDINIKTNVVMDMVVQLAMERERIQQKIFALAKENHKLLMERSIKAKEDGSSTLQETRNNNKKEVPSSRLNSTTSSCEATSHENAGGLSSKSFQVEESLDNASAAQTSIPADPNSNLVPKIEADNPVLTSQTSRMFSYVATFILLLSMSAAYLYSRKPDIFNISNG